MAARSLAHQSFTDVDEFQSEHHHVLHPVTVVEPSGETIDPVGPARGVILAVILCVPFWIAVFWAVFTL
jgi:hypothetical protein